MQPMNNSDNNLLSFLKNQSLFSQPPNNRRSSRSRERSRDRRSEMMRNSAANNLPFTGSITGGYNQSPSYNQNPNYNSNYNQNNQTNPTNNYNTGYNQSQNYNSNSNYNPNPNPNPTSTYNNPTSTYNNQPNQSSYTNNNRSFSPIQGIYNSTNNSQYQETYNTNYSNEQGNRNIQRPFEHQVVDNNAVVNLHNNPVVNPHNNPIVNPHNNAGVTYATSFQSARVESLQRLDNLARKVKTQIKILNEKIEGFSNEMIKVVNSQYNMTKEKIYQIVEETFRQSEHYLVQYRKREEMKFTEDINRAMRLLQQQIIHIDAMRNDIQKPYWKNTAGVFITTDFEAKIENMIRQTEGMNVKHFDFNTEGYHLKDIQREVIDRLKGRLDGLKNTEFGRPLY